MSAETLRVFSTLATQVAWPELTRQFKHISGATIEDVFGPTNALIPRIKSGETADVAILVRQSAHELEKAGVLAGCRDIASSVVGLGVKAGAAKPDISTPEKLKAVLLGCTSIAYSRQGASGIYFAGLIQKLGIADAINAKATIIPLGLTGERVIAGETEMAVQQLSELQAVRGIDIAGAFPMSLQEPTVLTAAIFAKSGRADLARRFVDYLASGEARGILKASGLDPIAG